MNHGISRKFSIKMKTFGLVKAGKHNGLLDTVHWQSDGDSSSPRKVVLDWVPSFTRDNIPDVVKFIGTFKTLTGVYEHTVSSTLLKRSDLSIVECCEQEVSLECLPMCKAKNLVDSLTMSTESCKAQMHKLQRCYLTGKDLDQFNPEEAVIVERTNFLRLVFKTNSEFEVFIGSLKGKGLIGRLKNV